MGQVKRTTLSNSERACFKRIQLKMDMFFYQSTDVVVLFEGWHCKTMAQYFFTCIAAIFIGIIRHAISFWQRRVTTPNNHKKNDDHCAQTTPFLDADESQELGWLSGRKIGGSFLYMIGVTLSFFNMLIAMTYNIGLFCSVVIGEGVGMYLFGEAPACH